MAIRDRKRSNLPALLALVSLILLLLLLGYYFANCLKKNVLGVSTFNSSSSKNPVTNGETFNFAATVVGDQAGALNATVLFNLTGQGVIDSNIGGPGACAKLTDTTAACNNVNIDPNQTIVWTVPVTASSNCSQIAPPTLTLQTRLIATAVLSSSTASVSCVASQPSATQPPTTSTNSGAGGNATPSSGSYGQTNGGGAQQTTSSQNQGLPASTNFDFAGFACSKVSNFPLVFLLLILWVIACAYYFIFRRRN